MPKCTNYTKTPLDDVELHVPQIGHIAYSATVYFLRYVIFSKSTARLRELLKVVFNSCSRCIYGISRYEHIAQYGNRILAIPLKQFYSFRMCCTMNNIIKTGNSLYLFSEIQFGQFSRMFNILSYHFTDIIECLHCSSCRVQSCGMACHLRDEIAAKIFCRVDLSQS
jgi:hypothetical protein